MIFHPWVLDARLAGAPAQQATSHDVAVNGFKGLQSYRQLALPKAERALLEEVAADGEARESAAGALTEWADKPPFEVEPKLRPTEIMACSADAPRGRLLADAPAHDQAVHQISGGKLCCHSMTTSSPPKISLSQQRWQTMPNC